MSTVKKFEKQPVIPDPPNTRTDTKTVFLQKADVFNPGLKAWADSFNATVVDNLNALVDVLNAQLPYINTVSDADAAIRAVYTAIAQVNTVSAGIENVNACATWMDKIKLVAENMAEVVSAQGYAEEARKWALMAEAVVNVKPATKETLGLVMVGTGLNIDLEGTLDVAPDQISSTTAGGVITVKDVAIGGDLADLASARGQIGNAKAIGSHDFSSGMLSEKPGMYTAIKSGSSNVPFTGPFAEMILGSPTYRGSLLMTSGRHTLPRAAVSTIDTEQGFSGYNRLITEQQIGDGLTVNNGIISVPEYEGATASAAGTSGLVPPATAGQQESFLTGGGEYKPALTKISDSVNLADSKTAASAKAVKTAYDLANGKQAALGFTPVQQGGGTGQDNTKIYIGSAGVSGLKAQQGTTDLGNIVTTTAGTTRAPSATKVYVENFGEMSWISTQYTNSPANVWCLPADSDYAHLCSPSVLSVGSSQLTITSPNTRIFQTNGILPEGGSWVLIVSRDGNGVVAQLAGGSAVDTSGGVALAIRVA